MSAVADFVDVLIVHQGVLVPLFFTGVFIATFVGIAFNRNRHVRRTYVAGLLLMILATNTLMPFVPLPMENWHKFSSPRPAEQTDYEFRVVDDRGNEIRYEEKATLKADGGITMRLLKRRFVRDYSVSAKRFSAAERREAARYLLRQAKSYREDLRHRSPLRLLRFPPHGGTWTAWHPDPLADYGPFVGIRLYRVRTTTSEDGADVLSSSETVIFEYYENGTATSAVSNHTAARRVSAGAGGEPV